MVALLCDVLEAVQTLRPEGLQLLAELGQALPPGPIEVLAPLLVAVDQPGAEKHLQMLRHRRAAHRQLPCDLGHRAPSGRDPAEDPASGRIGQGVPWISGEDTHNA